MLRVDYKRRRCAYHPMVCSIIYNFDQVYTFTEKCYRGYKYMSQLENHTEEEEEERRGVKSGVTARDLIWCVWTLESFLSS